MKGLANRFGCELRTGRAESAPQLRKRELPTHLEQHDGDAGGEDDVDLMDIEVIDAMRHDEDSKYLHMCLNAVIATCVGANTYAGTCLEPRYSCIVLNGKAQTT